MAEFMRANAWLSWQKKYGNFMESGLGTKVKLTLSVFGSWLWWLSTKNQLRWFNGRDIKGDKLMKMTIEEISSGKQSAGKRQIFTAQSLVFFDQFSPAFIRPTSQLLTSSATFFCLRENHAPTQKNFLFWRATRLLWPVFRQKFTSGENQSLEKP